MKDKGQGTDSRRLSVVGGFQAEAGTEAPGKRCWSARWLGAAWPKQVGGAVEEVTGGVGQGSLGRQGYSAEFDFYCK